MVNKSITYQKLYDCIDLDRNTLYIVVMTAFPVHGNSFVPVYTQHSTRTHMESKQKMADKHVAETSTNTYLTQINLNAMFQMHTICYHLLSANIYKIIFSIRNMHTWVAFLSL